MAPSRDFLELFQTNGYADAASASAAYWTLKPFAGISRLDHYPLAPFLELDPRSLKQALSLAIGSPIRRFAGYSLIGARSSGILGDACVGLFRLSHDYPGGFQETLAEAVHQTTRRRLRSPDATLCLLESASALLEDSLWSRLRKTLAGVPSRGVRAVARENLWHCLLYGWACARRGDREEFERLRPLLGLMTRAIPIGELREDPGTWLILTC